MYLSINWLVHVQDVAHELSHDQVVDEWCIALGIETHTEFAVMCDMTHFIHMTCHVYSDHERVRGSCAGRGSRTLSWPTHFIHTWHDMPCLFRLAISHVLNTTDHTWMQIPYVFLMSEKPCHTHVHASNRTMNANTEWRRHTGCLIFRGHFPQNSPIISGSFADRDLQHKASYASSPPRRFATIGGGGSYFDMGWLRVVDSLKL